MKVTYVPGLSALPSSRVDHAVAIGIFDGLHKGHQYLLNAMLRKARARRLKSLVITFFPHPAHVLVPDVKLGYLVSLKQRLELLKGMGVEECIVLRFTKAFASVEPEKFIRQALVNKMRARAIYVGEDFRFGRNRAGDVALFKSLHSVGNYEMHGMKALKQGGSAVSSTRIRGLVAQGDLAGAARLLGRPFAMAGAVVHGSGRGRVLGFPTANVAYEQDVLPPNGVYAVRMVSRGKLLEGVANLGVRPSFKDRAVRPLLEVFLFDVQRSLYGQYVEVMFLKALRGERVFASGVELAEQIGRDVAAAKKVLTRG